MSGHVDVYDIGNFQCYNEPDGRHMHWNAAIKRANVSCGHIVAPGFTLFTVYNLSIMCWSKVVYHSCRDIRDCFVVGSGLTMGVNASGKIFINLV
jgi:hypothetical protein